MRRMRPLTPLFVFSLAVACSGARDVAGTDEPRGRNGRRNQGPVVPIATAPFDADIVGSTRWAAGHRAGIHVAAFHARDIATLDPLTEGEVYVAWAEGGERRELARTQIARAGTADLAFKVPDVEPGNYPVLVGIQTDEGTREVLTEVTVSRDVKVMLTTDKPLYQPGQTIHMRALALRAMDLHPAGNRPVTFEVADGRGNKVFRREVRANRHGVANIDFQLADPVNDGAYAISASVGEGAGEGPPAERTVDVRRYSLPKFRVEVADTEPFYRPGTKVRGSVRSEYFFGRKVANARVRIAASTFDVGWNEFATLEGRTDADGRFPFELDLPRRFAGLPLAQGNALLKVEVTVRDTAEHTERTTRTFPVVQDALRVEFVPESGHIVPDVENGVFAVVTYPDGRPAQADVKVTARGREQTARSDAAGIARVELTFVAAEATWHDANALGCANALGYDVTVEASDANGERVRADRCLPTDQPSTSPILLRTDRAMYRSGDTMRVTTVAPGTGPVFLSVIKGGQTVLTSTLRREGSTATREIDLPPDLFGTLEVHAYRIDAQNQILRDGRVVYVEPASDLRVEISPDQEEYRPGAEARVRFRVTDSEGQGVAAALGVIVVDESVYALSDAHAGLEKVFFTLEREIMTPRYELHFDDHHSVESLISERPDDRRNRAAQVVLSAIEPERTIDRIRDARQIRANFEASQLPQVYAAVVEYMLTHVAYERTDDDELRFRSDLMDRMIRAETITAELAQAPDGRLLSAGMLHRLDRSFTYGSVAKVAAQRRLMEISGVLAGRSDVRRLDDLVREDVITRDKLRDPWGGEFTLRASDSPRFAPSGVAAGYELCSAGPDRRFGTDDDVVNPFGRTVPDDAQGSFANFARSMGGGWGGQGGIAVLGARGDAPMMMDMAAEGGGRAGGGGWDMARVRAAPGAPPPPMAQAEAAATRAEESNGSGDGDARQSNAQRPAARVREFFPETMLWQPSVLTDENGDATLQVPIADSITTWRMSASASSSEGHLGAATRGMRVFQDFFVDLDLPPALTQNDEVSVPVAVYNYMQETQTVRLRLERDRIFDLVGAAEQSLTVEPGEVTVRYFRVKARSPGSGRLTVHAQGTRLSDAVRREVRIEPDGRPETFSQSDTIERGAEITVNLPEAAVAGSEHGQIKVYGGALAQAIDNLDSMLRMPSGCFEQTSSSTYPNVLILKYLRDSRRSSPEVEMKATEYIGLGYQRLLTYEVDGGGFEWFGNPPAHRILTAYGLMEFSDMAKVYEVDERVIARTQRWLESQQRPDGSWEPDQGGIAEGAINAYQGSVVKTTAYLTWAMVESGYEGPAVERGIAWLRGHRGEATDAYARAVVANALLAKDRRDRDGLAIVEQLATSATRDGNVVRWEDGAGQGMTFSTGGAHTTETTALAALALIRSSRHRDLVTKAIGFLIQNKDSFGNWDTTQATILTLRTLLAVGEQGSDERANVTVSVNGREIGRIAVTPENRDVMQMLDLKPHLRRGENRIRLQASADAGLFFQVAGGFHVPWGPAGRPEPAAANEPLEIDVAYDRTSLEVDDTVQLTATLRYRGAQPAQMPLVDLGVPPGFEVEAADLNRLVEAHTISRFSITPRQVIVYLEELRPGATVTIQYHLRAKFPVRAQAPASEAYLYYTPEERDSTRPTQLVVNARAN